MEEMRTCFNPKARYNLSVKVRVDEVIYARHTNTATAISTGAIATDILKNSSFLHFAWIFTILSFVWKTKKKDWFQLFCLW